MLHILESANLQQMSSYINLIREKIVQIFTAEYTDPALKESHSRLRNEMIILESLCDALLHKNVTPTGGRKLYRDKENNHIYAIESVASLYRYSGQIMVILYNHSSAIIVVPIDEFSEKFEHYVPKEQREFDYDAIDA